MIINTKTATLEEIKAASTTLLVKLYNKITGKDIKKFRARSNAESQTWKAIGTLSPEENYSVEDGEVEVIKTVAPIKKEKTNGKRADYEHRLIDVITKENPKREGSGAHKKYELLLKFDGKTIGEYRALEGKYPTLDKENGWPSTVIRWSLKVGDIKLVNPAKQEKAA